MSDPQEPPPDAGETHPRRILKRILELCASAYDHPSRTITDVAHFYECSREVGRLVREHGDFRMCQIDQDGYSYSPLVRLEMVAARARKLLEAQS